MPEQNEILDTLEEALGQRDEITVAPCGYSMGGIFRNCEALVIHAFRDGRVRIGDVLVYRREKQWVLADAVRERLTDLGVALEDGAQGTEWRWA